MRKLPTKDVFIILRNGGTEDEYLEATTDLDVIEDNQMYGRYTQVSLERMERTVATKIIIQRKAKSRA